MKKKKRLTLDDLNNALGGKDKKHTRDKNYYGDSWQKLSFKEKVKTLVNKENKDVLQNLIIVCGVIMLVVLSCVAINRVESNLNFTDRQLAAENLSEITGVAADTAANDKESEQAGGDTLNNDNDYFINYEMEKEKVRSEQLELLNEMTENKDTLPDVKKEAENKILSITEDMENEMLLESLLVAKYGGEAVVFVQEDKVNVILRPNGVTIDDNEADKIAQLVDTYTNIGYENAIIVIKD